jgi:ATP-dependent protease ClpP protease subunit
LTLGRLRVERKLPNHLHVDQRLKVDVTLKNLRRFFGLWAIRVDDRLQRESGTVLQTSEVGVFFPRVAAGQTRQVGYEGDRCLDLLKQVRQIDRELRAEQISRDMEDAAMTPIWLHIHSYGGDLFSGFSTSDQLRRIKSPIYSVVEGMCASAATLIALSATKRFILPNSFMLIHQLSALMSGTHEDFKDEMVLQEKLMNSLVKFYVEGSKMSDEELRDQLKRDYWMDAETAVEKGFVDAILA